jgi:hypothetical protein
MRMRTSLTRAFLGRHICLLTLAQALCHCADCRKISGGNYSNNIVVPSENFKVVSGTPKRISKTADSGKEITSKSSATVQKGQA